MAEIRRKIGKVSFEWIGKGFLRRWWDALPNGLRGTVGGLGRRHPDRRVKVFWAGHARRWRGAEMRYLVRWERDPDMEVKALGRAYAGWMDAISRIACAEV